jgi:hypothetical protein
MKSIYIKYYLAGAFPCTSLLGFNIFSLPVKASQSLPIATQSKKTNVTSTTIKAADNTWGYDIYIDNKKVIHQPNIPGVSSNKGFATEKNASKAAKLIVSKIKYGQIPPTVSIEKLHAIKAL